MSDEKIAKIGKIDSKVKGELPIQPNKEHFDAAMAKQRIQTETAIEQPAAEINKNIPSLMDQVREVHQKIDNLSGISTDNLIASTEKLTAQIDTIKDKLAQPDLDMRSSYQPLLTGKLEHINDNLKILVEKTGGEFSAPKKVEGSLAKPIDNFLHLLSHGQSQLQTIAADLKELQTTARELTPANMLLVQIKVNQITQEIELFTAMLNKALESTKTIMNVQV